MDQIHQVEMLTISRKQTIISMSSPILKKENLEFPSPHLTEELRLLSALRHKEPLLVLLIKKFLEFSDSELASNLKFIYPMLCDLALSPSAPLRHYIRQTLLRLGKLIVPKFSGESDLFQVEIPADEFVQEMDEPEEVLNILTITGTLGYSNKKTETTNLVLTKKKSKQDSSKNSSNSIKSDSNLTKTEPVDTIKDSGHLTNDQKKDTTTNHTIQSKNEYKNGVNEILFTAKSERVSSDGGVTCSDTSGDSSPNHHCSSSDNACVTNNGGGEASDLGETCPTPNLTTNTFVNNEHGTNGAATDIKNSAIDGTKTIDDTTDDTVNSTESSVCTIKDNGAKVIGTSIKSIEVNGNYNDENEGKLAS